MAKLKTGTTIGGSIAWHSSNDGSASGLDADLLDGIQSTSFLRSDTGDTFSGGILTVANDAGIDITNTGGINGLQIFQATGSADAIMTFHISGNHAVHFGLDGETDDLSVGGWSLGAVKHKIWHAGNDGASSGLDADLLDGNHASAFATTSQTMHIGTTAVAINRASAALSLTGVSIDGNAGTATTLQNTRTINGTSFNGSANITTASWGTARTLTVGATGKSVDGSANVSWSITEVIPTSTNFQVNSLGVGTAASTTAGEIRATNEITAFYSSDATLKENIRPIDSALDKVCAIGGKYFDWKDEYIEKRGGEDGYFVRKSDFGMIAQDVEKNFPVAVRKREDGTLALDYEKMCALAFEAIRELREEIEKLKREV